MSAGSHHDRPTRQPPQGHFLEEVAALQRANPDLRVSGHELASAPSERPVLTVSSPSGSDVVEARVPLTASRSEIYAALSGHLPAMRPADPDIPNGYPPEPGQAEPADVYAYLLHDLGIWSWAFAEEFARSFVVSSFSYHSGARNTGDYAVVTVEESADRTRYRTLVPLDRGGPAVGTPMSIVEAIVAGKYHRAGEIGVFERDWRRSA